MGIAFFRNLFGRRRVTHMPLQPETPPTPQPEQEEQPKTPWQQLVAKEIAQGNITEADRELLHEVDLPDVLNCEAITTFSRYKILIPRNCRLNRHIHRFIDFISSNVVCPICRHLGLTKHISNSRISL